MKNAISRYASVTMLGVISVLGVNCGDGSDLRLDALQKSENALSSKFKKLWRNHVRDSQPPEGYVLQPGCEPRIIAASRDVPRRGTIIMVHGYSACNQQFYDWGAHLAAAGYTVVLPLMPGHGMQPATDGNEFDFLPFHWGYGLSWSRYDEFAMDMADLAAVAPGPTRAVAGLSVGGAVAAAIAEHGQNEIDKALLMAPFFAIPGTFSPNAVADSEVEALSPEEEALIAEIIAQEDIGGENLTQSWERIGEIIARVRTQVLQAVVGLVKGAEKLPQIAYGWGEPCKQQTLFGRAGICDFQIMNLLAVDSFGREIVSRYRASKGIDVDVQIVAVENDTGADGLAIETLAGHLGSVLGPERTAFCAFDGQVVPHSFLSKYENINLVSQDEPNLHERTKDAMDKLWFGRFQAEASEFFDSSASDFFATADGRCQREL